MNKQRRTVIKAGAALASLAAAGRALAQLEYPSKPVRIILPFAPGGGGDIIARYFGQKLSTPFGQAVYVENKPGAGGLTGIEIGLASPPDGHTLMLVSTSYTLHPATTRLKFDAIADVTPIVQISQGPMIIAAHPSFGPRTVRELIAYAKANAGKVNTASAGIGAVTGMAGEYFNTLAQIHTTQVPYKSGGLAINDTLAGVTDITFSAVAAAIPHIRAGKLRPIATTGPQRLAALPDVPTVMESGLPGYEVSLWHGLIGPKGMPRVVVDRINAEINRVLTDPEARDKLATDGVFPAGGTPEQFAALIRRDITQWRKVASEAGVVPQ